MSDQESAGLRSQQPKSTPKNKWLWIGAPVAVAVILAAVLGGVLGSRAAKKSSAQSAEEAASSSEAAASSASGIKEAVGLFPTATNSLYMQPLYPSTTNAAAFTTPTFHNNDHALAWPQDTFAPASPKPTAVRQDHPRLIAPQAKWDALPQRIQGEPYLKAWNDTIFGNATAYFDLPPVKYFLDGDSGILDNAREIKQRVKAFAYVYRLTKDKKWVDRTFAELQNAVSDSFGPSGTDKWNPTHFLDTAEFVAAYAIAYDWLHDAWTADQRTQIASWMKTYGLEIGVTQYTTGAGWWSQNVQGNWNCVCNSGLTLGALAIQGEDDSGIVDEILSRSIPNAVSNCARAVTSDGTWTETANYWYFGTTAHAEMASALLTATGSHYGLLDSNPDFEKTGVYHMYVNGPGSLFAYGDHGPNKFSTTANSIIFYGDFYNRPEFMLYQRDQHDAAEPWSMFWYNPTVSGAFWNGLALDHFFDDSTDQWGSMRSSWTDQKALFVAMKAGQNQGHANHNDLDAGDFVLDANGVRWAGELGSGDYRSKDYFVGANPDDARWRYYRKRTEGQNTIVVSKANQKLDGKPTIKFDTTGEKQGSPTVYNVPQDSTAFFTADLAAAYNNVNSFRRGIRTLNGRKQVLLQDDIDASGDIQWRMHTNATVDASGTSATLTIDDKKLQMTILNAPEGATFSTGPAVRFEDDPPLPDGQTDQANLGVTVVSISLPAGQYSIQVLFNPEWDEQTNFVTPPSVPVGQWSLQSHN